MSDEQEGPEDPIPFIEAQIDQLEAQMPLQARAHAVIWKAYVGAGMPEELANAVVLEYLQRLLDSPD